jgi:hypothetical protein
VLFRRGFDFDGGAKFVLAGIADPRIKNTSLAAKLGATAANSISPQRGQADAREYR